MIRREFVKLAAASIGFLGAPRIAGVSLRSVHPAHPLYLSAEIGVFFPSLSLIRRLQEEPWRSFIIVEGNPAGSAGTNQFEVALRLPAAALENCNYMTETDRALVEQRLMEGLRRELPRRSGDVHLQVSPAPAFFHPYLADAQNETVFCRVERFRDRCSGEDASDGAFHQEKPHLTKAVSDPAIVKTL
jgi:hypothetical protein